MLNLGEIKKFSELWWEAHYKYKEKIIIEALTNKERHDMTEIKKTDYDNAMYAMDKFLRSMVGVPTRYQDNPDKFKGYFSVINLWYKKNGFDIEYIYFVLNNLYERFNKAHGKVTMGYILGALNKSVDQYDPEKHKLPSGGDREGMLEAGHTVDTLPYHLKTKEEREATGKKILVDGEIGIDSPLLVKLFDENADNSDIDKFLDKVQTKKKKVYKKKTIKKTKEEKENG